MEIMATTNRMPDQKNNPSSQSTGTFGEHASKAVSEVKEAGVALASQAKETAVNLASQAKEGATAAVSAIQEKASDLASGVAERADAAIHATGKGMENLAAGIRERSPSEGILGTASCKVADTLESSGKYLEEHGMGDMVNDLTDIIRRNPIPSVLVGVGIGFVLARATSRN
jgi:ElaB/YqjD/DUF883 family membrane-anchored ribosome-binding protein